MILGAVRDGPGEETDKREGRHEDDPLEDEFSPGPAAAIFASIVRARDCRPHGGTARQARAQLHCVVIILLLYGTPNIHKNTLLPIVIGNTL